MYFALAATKTTKGLLLLLEFKTVTADRSECQTINNLIYFDRSFTILSILAPSSSHYLLYNHDQVHLYYVLFDVVYCDFHEFQSIIAYVVSHYISISRNVFINKYCGYVKIIKTFSFKNQSKYRLVKPY